MFAWVSCSPPVTSSASKSDLFPEIYEDEEEESEDPEEAWTRYEGDDPQLVLVNECADTWESWVPESPAEEALKDAVEKATGDSRP